MFLLLRRGLSRCLGAAVVRGEEGVDWEALSMYATAGGRAAIAGAATLMAEYD
jgi:hypothetical protein